MGSRDAGVRFTARMYMEHYVRQRHLTIRDIGVAQRVVVSWAPGVIDRLAKRIDAEPMRHWPWAKRQRCYTGQGESGPISFVEVGMGAPATVAGMEQLIACGARTIVGLGWAGSLQSKLAIGSMVIPTECISDEGTSHHYLEERTALVPDASLLSQIKHAASAIACDATCGAVWSTDGIYRERCSIIDDYRKQGVLAVDMESSAMYALGLFRNVAVCNLLVINDEVWRPWRTAAFTDAIRTATESAADVVMSALI
jgi:uridine phosphorylase